MLSRWLNERYPWLYYKKRNLSKIAEEATIIKIAEEATIIDAFSSGIEPPVVVATGIDEKFIVKAVLHHFAVNESSLGNKCLRFLVLESEKVNKGNVEYIIWDCITKGLTVEQRKVFYSSGMTIDAEIIKHEAKEAIYDKTNEILTMQAQATKVTKHISELIVANKRCYIKSLSGQIFEFLDSPDPLIKLIYES